MEAHSDRQTILIVDDCDINRSILTDILGHDFDIREASDGHKAVALIEQYQGALCLVLLDIVMPNMDGFQVLETMQRNRWMETIPVIILSPEGACVPLTQAYELGVCDYISRPFDAQIVLRRVRNTVKLYANQKRLTTMVTAQLLEQKKNNELMVDIFSHIVEFRNGESDLHVLHIRTLTQLLLDQLLQKTDEYHRAYPHIALIATASALHDIGKIAIPLSILNKPERLDGREFALMKTHCAEGISMLEQLPQHRQEPLLQVAYDICRWHHERYDGTGYPDGLVGDAIPISAQMVALADVYDALTSKLVYKPAYSHQQAMAMILKGECGTFNPLLLTCLQELSEHLSQHFAPGVLRAERVALGPVCRETPPHNEPIASARTLDLLEHERTKYQFFASMSQEAHFEFTLSPSSLSLSQWGAELLGLPQIILSPATSPALAAVLRQEEFDAMYTMLYQTTPTAPVVEHCCPIIIQGQPRWSKIVLRSMWSGDEPPKLIGSIGKLMDIHEEYQRIQTLEDLATQDALTGLLNHRAARKRIETLLSLPLPQHYAMAVIDLDYFKTANDTYGHLFGDGVLKHVSNRLRHSIRSSDLAARVGGDEFMLFMAFSGDPTPQINRIFQILTDTYESFPICVSMGICVYAPETGGCYEDLFQKADQALYAAKDSGRNQFRFYNPSMDVGSTLR